jgi:hypothetical protein
MEAKKSLKRRRRNGSGEAKASEIGDEAAETSEEYIAKPRLSGRTERPTTALINVWLNSNEGYSPIFRFLKQKPRLPQTPRLSP